MLPTSLMEVDLDAIEWNLSVVRRACSAALPRPGGPGAGVGVCAVLKADGYGMGAVPIARRLEACGVELIAVYRPAEASRLLEAGVRTPLLLLMPARGADLDDDRLREGARDGRLHLTLHGVGQMRSLLEWCGEIDAPLRGHLEVDTGMSRGGASPKEASAVARLLAERGEADGRSGLFGVMTHFASAERDDARTRAQATALNAWLDENREAAPRSCVVHQANSAGVFRSTRLHMDMVRVGLALLGYGVETMGEPGTFALVEHAERLRPAVRWTSRVVHLSRVESGATVGYGGTWRAERPAMLALVPVGYADGYPLSLSNRGALGVRLDSGETLFAPVVGAVSMDQVIIDVSEGGDGVRVGSEVEVFGTDPTSPTYLAATARAAGTTIHELLCRQSERVEKRHICGGPGGPAARRRADQNETTSVRK